MSQVVLNNKVTYMSRDLRDFTTTRSDTISCNILKNDMNKYDLLSYLELSKSCELINHHQSINLMFVLMCELVGRQFISL